MKRISDNSPTRTLEVDDQARPDCIVKIGCYVNALAEKRRKSPIRTII
jgi:hypothetical protein